MARLAPEVEDSPSIPGPTAMAPTGWIHSLEEEHEDLVSAYPYQPVARPCDYAQHRYCIAHEEQSAFLWTSLGRY